MSFYVIIFFLIIFQNISYKIVKLRVVGGEPAGSSLAQKVGPLGLPAKKVSEDIAKATAEYKGLRVAVKLTIQNRQATIEVVPASSTMIIKGLKEPSRDRKKEKNIKHHGNLSLDQIITIARISRPRSLAKTLSGTVREILGTCSSMGCSVDGISPRSMIEKILEGDVEIPAN